MSDFNEKGERAMKTQEEAPASEPSQGQETIPQEQEANPEEELIENILDMIPIFQ